MQLLTAGMVSNRTHTTALARTAMALSPSSGSQNALTSPVANIWKGEVPSGYSGSQGINAKRLKEYLFIPRANPLKHPARCVPETTKIHRLRYYSHSEAFQRANTTKIYHQNTFRFLHPNLVYPAMKHYVYACLMHNTFGILTPSQFQYVSLLRFASKMHEKFSLSEKELNTWKDREKSIVDCLAATESLSR